MSLLKNSSYLMAIKYVKGREWVLLSFMCSFWAIKHFAFRLNVGKMCFRMLWENFITEKFQNLANSTNTKNWNSLTPFSAPSPTPDSLHNRTHIRFCIFIVFRYPIKHNSSANILNSTFLNNINFFLSSDSFLMEFSNKEEKNFLRKTLNREIFSGIFKFHWKFRERSP